MKSIEILDALEQEVSYIESCIEEYNNSLAPSVPIEYLSACIKENSEVVGEIYGSKKSFAIMVMPRHY